MQGAVERGKDRWSRRWNVAAVEEDLPWLRLTAVDGVRLSRQDLSPVVLTAWLITRHEIWVRQERDRTSTTDGLAGRAEVVRVVRAVVDDALVPWPGWLARRPLGWKGADDRGPLRLHASLRPVGPPPEPPKAPA